MDCSVKGLESQLDSLYLRLMFWLLNQSQCKETLINVVVVVQSWGL